jgi:hypothetical protein
MKSTRLRSIAGLVLSALLCCGWGELNAQTWHARPILPENEILNALSMRNARVGIAVGKNGVIRKAQWYAQDTDLRSLLWSTEQIALGITLHDVVHLESTGYVIVGEGGRVWRAATDDAEPVVVSVPVFEDLLGVAARGKVVIGCGTRGTMIRSVDGGSTFVTVTMPTQEDIVDVCADGTGNWTAITATEILRSSNGAQWTLTQTTSGVEQRRIMTMQRPVFNDWILYRLGDPWVYEVSTDGGKTWINAFADAASMRMSKPYARALSMSVSANALQHSIMFVDGPANNPTPFHFVSFNAAVSWYDLCTLFFSEFVGTAQAMVADTTLLCSGLSGPMLTFSRLGSGSQYRWSAPESVKRQFQPLASSISANGVLVADKRSVVDCDREFSEARYSFFDQFIEMRSVASVGAADLLLADTTWHELDGVEIKTLHRSRLYHRTNGGEWTLLFEHPENVNARSLTTGGDQTALMIPTGKTTVWFDDIVNTMAPRLVTYPDTSYWNTSLGSLLSTTTAWCQVIQLSEVQRPRGYVTTDGGGSWRLTPPHPFYAVSSTATSTGTLVISGYERLSPLQVRVMIARSTDVGVTWSVVLDQTVHTSSTNYVPILHRDGRLLALAPNKVWLSDSDGLSWTALDVELQGTDAMATGHWLSDTTVAVYTQNGLVMTTSISRPVTALAADPSNDTEASMISPLSGGLIAVPPSTISVFASDLLGRTAPLEVMREGARPTVELLHLPHGLWVLCVQTSTSFLTYNFEHRP